MTLRSVPGPYMVDGRAPAADDVAVGQVGAADDVVVGADVEQHAVVALRTGVLPGAVEADPVADDPVAGGVRAVEHDAAVEVGEREPADDVVGARDVQAVSPCAAAPLPRSTTPGTALEPVRGVFGRAPAWV